MNTDDNSPQISPRKSPGRLGRRGAIGATAAGLVLGGIAGGYVVTHAATSTPSAVAGSSGAGATPAPATSTPSSGTFHPNENTSHEAGESATREAQENSGQAPAAMSGTFHPNENGSHEAGESAAREAQESSGQRPTVP
jgi:hypothetical protein